MSLGTALVIAAEVFWEIVYVPVWWYTNGAGRALSRFYRRLKDGDEYLGWGVWFFNIFTPMYAQNDLAGRLISFGVRVAQAAVRTLLFLVWIIIDAVLLAAYFVLPVVTLAEIIYQLGLII